MTTKYVCLSDTAVGPLFNGYTRDRRARWTSITKGKVVGDCIVDDFDIAAKAFATRMARREFGSKSQIWGPSCEGIVPNGKIFRCTIGGGLVVEKRFAVVEQEATTK